MPNIINNDQTGFLKNRFIGENIRLIENIINHANMEQIPGLSPYLFILRAEMLGSAVRRDTEIRGIKLGNSECKLSQYADDTTMISDGSERSFSRTLHVLDTLANVSGLKANNEESEALWIGSHKNTNAVISFE